MATAVLALVPPVAVVMLMQRWFVEGPDRRRQVDGRPWFLTTLRKSFGAVAVLHGIDLTMASRRDAGDRRRLRLRQVHPAAAGGGAGSATAGRILLDGRDVARLDPAGAGHRHGVPELRALSAYVGLRQHGLRAAHPRPDATATLPHGWRRRRSCWAWCRCWAQAAPVSGGQRQRVAMGAPSCASRNCSCSTSRCPTWTPRCGCRCAPKSGVCNGAWG